MDTKHTPGPWIAQRDLYNTPYEKLGFGIYSAVTHLRLAEITPAFQSGTVYGHAMENQGSTAALIASAPELLEKLEKMTQLLSYLYHNGRIKDNAPGRERIEQAILDAEYTIEKATTPAE